MNYQNGKIYKIVSDLTDKIYIGSTTQPLYKRLGHHKGVYKESLTGKNKHITSFELIKLGDTRIELIEDFPCERKEQLNAREGYYIRLNKNICVNRCIAGRNKQEWYEANKDKVLEHQKQYREDNKDKVLEQKKQYYEANKAKIAEQQKQYKESKKAKKIVVIID